MHLPLHSQKDFDNRKGDTMYHLCWDCLQLLIVKIRNWCDAGDSNPNLSSDYESGAYDHLSFRRNLVPVTGIEPVT